MFALFLNLRARTQSSTGTLVFFQIGKGLKFLIWTQGEIHPGNRANRARPFNRAPVMSPLFRFMICRFFYLSGN